MDHAFIIQVHVPASRAHIAMQKLCCSLSHLLDDDEISEYTVLTQNGRALDIDDDGTPMGAERGLAAVLEAYAKERRIAEMIEATH